MTTDYTISFFNNPRDTTPKAFTLLEWLSSTMNPTIYADKVNAYRSTLDKDLKLKLPCVTVSASFKENRDLEHIDTINELICLDVDRKENPVVDMELVKHIFSKHPSCLYAAYSVSNKGIYAIFKVSKDKDLLFWFNYFKKRLKKVGIKIDESCKDYTRLRFYSIDKDAYFNPEAKLLKIKKKVKQPQATTGGERIADYDKVMKVISLIEQHGIDITSGYEDWVKIAGALNHSFGESGRDMYHRISKFHPDYSSKKTDKKYDHCRKMGRVNIGSLFYIANSYGIRY